MSDEIQLLDVVALVSDIPKHNLFRGEIGAVVECYPNNSYEVEFISQDGHTYALVALHADQLIQLRQKAVHTATQTVPAIMFIDRQESSDNSSQPARLPASNHSQ
ncbi:DUF4926 domain-containing protein [Chloroflexi bacterium TSY]|nr:DUF4926 domain-containing protein [Chloroflexi bacterium TSY]